MHSVEFGRIALLNKSDSSLSGKYYVYIKVDGSEVLSSINAYDVSKMDGNIFLNFGSLNKTNKVYDIDYDPVTVTYEKADEISLLDLKRNGSEIDEKILLDRYQTQLELYKDMLEASFSMKVKEKIIYSFHMPLFYVLSGILLFAKKEYVYDQSSNTFSSSKESIL